MTMPRSDARTFPAVSRRPARRLRVFSGVKKLLTMPTTKTTSVRSRRTFGTSKRKNSTAAARCVPGVEAKEAVGEELREGAVGGVGAGPGGERREVEQDRPAPPSGAGGAAGGGGPAPGRNDGKAPPRSLGSLGPAPAPARRAGRGRPRISSRTRRKTGSASSPSPAWAGSSNAWWTVFFAPGKTGQASRAESQTVTTRSKGRARSVSTDLLVCEERSTPASRHHLDRPRVDEGGPGPGRVDLDAVAEVVADPPLADLRAAGVPGAEDEDARLRHVRPPVAADAADAAERSTAAGTRTRRSRGRSSPAPRRAAR